jgi:YegS/Rv2252/BmrU family lipid kinase
MVVTLRTERIAAQTSSGAYRARRSVTWERQRFPKSPPSGCGPRRIAHASRMTNPKTRVAVVLNAGSGDGSAEQAATMLEALFTEAGFEFRIDLLKAGDDLPKALDRAIADKVDIIVAGGGDGTVNSVVNAIAGHDVTLGVLPLGTLNHFAKDLGVPIVMEEAARVIVAGHTMQVDLGEVNGRLFVNNSSVGLYPRIVQLRERYRARGVEKWIVAAWATLRVTRQQKPLRTKIVVDGRDVLRATPLVFVGNNEYRMAGFDAGSRESLRGGKLALYVVKNASRWQLFQLVWRILAGTATESGTLAMAMAVDAAIDVPFDDRVTQLPVAVDGEVTTLDLPLRYAIRPGALRVIVPV